MTGVPSAGPVGVLSSVTSVPGAVPGVVAVVPGAVPKAVPSVPGAVPDAVPFVPVSVSSAVTTVHASVPDVALLSPNILSAPTEPSPSSYAVFLFKKLKSLLLHSPTAS